MQFRDVFYLQSAKGAAGKNGSLHVSDLPVPAAVRVHPTYVSDVYEVNCAPTEARFQILPWQDFQAAPAPGGVHGGGVVMLSLPERGSCLAQHARCTEQLQFVATDPAEVRTSSMWKVPPRPEPPPFQGVVQRGAGAL